MRFQKEASLHNKFEIIKRNINTGEVEKAYAKNLVTDYGLKRALRGWFLNQGQIICIGRVATAPKPTNTKLNSQIGYKVSTLEELVINENEGYAYRKMKIVLLPGDFVGEKITEVGLGQGNNLHTHAILQDSEGNPISINKTDVDEITIYATLYVRGEMGNGSVVSVIEGILNANLTNTLASNYSDTIRLAEGGHIAKRESSILASNYSKIDIPHGQVIYDEVNMIRRCKSRFETDNGNHLVNSVGTNSCRIGLLESSFWNGTFWEGQVGVGDGVTTEFDTPFHTIDSTRLGSNVKVNGLEKEVELNDFKSDISLGSLIYDYGEINPYPFMTPSAANTGNADVFEVKLELTKAISMKGIMGSGGSNQGGFRDVKLYYSLDNVDYIDVDVDSGAWGFSVRANTPATYEFSSTPKAKYFKIILSNSYLNRVLSNLNLIPNLPQKQIKFPTPPAVGEIITAKLWTDGIPKDDKHVLDVTIDLKFKDGGAI